MATFNRVPFPEALDALEKGLGGATRGLKGLGVVMSDAEVNAKAVQMGLAQTTVDLGKVDKATTAAKKAQITYNDAVKKHGQNSSEAQKAMLTLESATAAVDTAMESGKTTVDAAGKAQAIYALTLEKTEMQQGAAERAAKSAGGQNERAAAQWKDMQAELGQKLLPIMAQWATIMNEHIVPALASVATFVADNAQYLVPLVAIIGGTVVAMKAWKVATELWKSAQQIATAAQWAFNAAIHANPIGLIILAIAAFIAILVLAYKNVDWFRDAVDAMGRGAVAAFNWVLDAGRAVFNWAKDNWPLLLGILTGPFGLAVALIVKNFDTIRDAFRAAINFVIDGWNSISFKLPEIDTKIPGIGKIGGGSFSAPKIPRLDQGGIITQTGLILAHAGEAITPAPAGVGGPAVNIEKAYFSDAADVNVLLRETEYALTAGRL
jgi:hypothetical protein